MQETSSVVPGATRSSKLPSRSTVTPLVVPGTITAAPMTGSPLVSRTLPLETPWADAGLPSRIKAMLATSAMSAVRLTERIDFIKLY